MELGRRRSDGEDHHGSKERRPARSHGGKNGSVQSQAGRDFRGAVRQALKKSKDGTHEGVQHGKITVSAPMSSAIGQLFKCFA